MPKISICIPAYNQIKYLCKTLDSILIQGFQDYEVILTDDTPGDAVANLVETFDFQGRLKYFHNEIPLGSPKNWNFCISKACGEYIKILHHDDWFSSGESLENFVQAIENSEASIVFSNADVYYEKSNKTGFHAPGLNNLLNLVNDPAILFFNNFIGAPSVVMYKRQFHLDFDENLKWVVDTDFYIRYLRLHLLFKHIEKPLVTILAEGEHTVTAICQDNKNVEVFETFYLFNKLKSTLKYRELLNYTYFLVRLLKRFNISKLKEIKQAGYTEKLPLYFKFIFHLSHLKMRVVNFLKETKYLYLSLQNSLLKKMRFAWKASNEVRSNFKKISYSQSGEDLIIDFIFNHLGIAMPSYMDIGAHHPFYLSNTALFYERGCRGINIEPDPELFKLFKLERQDDLNLNIGVGLEKTHADFYIISSPTLNTFSKETAKGYSDEGDYKIINTINIGIDSLKNIIDQYNNGVFPQFLNVDAEGIDELIIKSIDYKQSYPIVICIETLSFSTSGNGIKNNSISNFLLDNGYMIYADTNINTIFVKENIWKNDDND